MNPATKSAVATIQQVGRRFSSSYANNSRSSLGRVAEFLGSTNSAPRLPSSHQATELAMAQKRTKSSMAIEYDEADEAVAASLANATYDQSVREPFPSIVLGPERSVKPQGSFAEAQAEVREKRGICICTCTKNRKQTLSSALRFVLLVGKVRFPVVETSERNPKPFHFVFDSQLLLSYTNLASLLFIVVISPSYAQYI